jgi:hypothetical protein
MARSRVNPDAIEPPLIPVYFHSDLLSIYAFKDGDDGPH